MRQQPAIVSALFGVGDLVDAGTISNRGQATDHVGRLPSAACSLRTVSSNTPATVLQAVPLEVVTVIAPLVAELGTVAVIFQAAGAPPGAACGR
jgi:hypothetical protein